VSGGSLGVRAFTYDRFARLATATDGAGRTTTYSYDFGDRTQLVSYSDGTPSVSYAYDPTSNFSGSRTEGRIKGFEAIGVSRTDDVHAAAAGNANAWKAPVIAARNSATTFADKEQIWADNAASSPHFGSVYVCYAEFRCQGPLSSAQRRS